MTTLHEGNDSGISFVPPATAFDMAYSNLAERGKADSLGGSEYRRVLAEWVAAGLPDPEPFIYRRANIGPDGQEPPAPIRHATYGYGTVVRRTGSLAYVRWDDDMTIISRPSTFSVPVVELVALR